MKLLLSFALAGLLALCVSYLTLAYYRLLSIAKGIAGPFEWPADVASSGDHRAYLERRCDSGAYLGMDSCSPDYSKASFTFKTAGLNRLSVHSRKDRRRLDGVS